MTAATTTTTTTAFFPCNSDSFIDYYYVLLLQKNDDSYYSPHVSSFGFATITALLVFLISTLTGNFSQVDKLWSILPAIYAWLCYATSPINDTRTILMTFLVSCWSIRLTYNFYIRGGYTFPKFWQGEEDYRWEVLRGGGGGGGNTSNSLLKGTPLIYLASNKYLLHVFNLLFISFFQNYLLLYITSPSLVAWEMAMRSKYCNYHDNSLKRMDCIATAIFINSLIGQTIADNQQRQFQKEKRECILLQSRTNTSEKKEDLTKLSIRQLREKVGSISGISLSINEMKVWSKKELVDILATNREHIRRGMKMNANSMNTIGSYEDGFYQLGLFSIVRKPAYAFEQLIWISYYLFSLSATMNSLPTGWVYHYWSMGGCILLCLLFQGSGWLTEKISTSKYPAYGVYMESVPLYVPRVSSLWSLLTQRMSHKKDV